MSKRLNALYGWLLILPAVSLLAAFTHLPAVMTLLASVHSTPRGTRPPHFVGLDNYRDMMADPIFWQSLWNNLIYALATIPVSVALALTMALLVNRSFPGRSLARLAFFTPTVLPMIAVANIWLFFYTPDYGLLDRLVGFLGMAHHNWLGERGTALWALIAVAIWKESGFFMIFYLAALQQIPATLREAAALEGAGPWTCFRRVTLPLLMPTTLFVLINALINAFRMVDHVVVMTRGGPDNATSLLLFHIFEVGFRFWDSAYAATLTVVLVTILSLVAALKFHFLDSRTHYR
ncbi:ABC transporter permease [Telmatospirillum siberiense]|uniref:ABC transporter permease n=2 Tax=Telmatospirillum siberiense TaxID=382514 RepID=A0A2N3PVC0_9PROT|nr:ABC transporter permease [Telmatospirillum siberiense]